MYVQAYECECGHIMPKYKEACGWFPPTPYFAFYDCCPKCGRGQDKIKEITGKWTYKTKTTGWLFFKTKYRTKDKFIKSQFCN